MRIQPEGSVEVPVKNIDGAIGPTPVALKDGEIIFALVVPVQSIALVEALAPFSFPPIFKTHLIHVRQRNELQKHPDMALRSLYFTLAEAYLNPKPPGRRC